MMRFFKRLESFAGLHARSLDTRNTNVSLDARELDTEETSETDATRMSKTSSQP
jgi:hypothetical protein